MQKHHEHHSNTDSSSSSSKLVQGRRVQKLPVTRELKDWFVASLCTVMNVPFLHLSHPLYRCIFEMAGFGTVNADLARKCIDREHEKSRKLLARDFRELKRQGITFTLITDEWTNPQGERFVAVILRSPAIIPSRGKNTIELMCRIRTGATAENLLDLVKTALKEVDLTIEDISALVTDAAATMLKLARLLAGEKTSKMFFHQTCYAHGIHLAVRDTLNDKKSPPTDETQRTSFLGISRVGEGDDDEDHPNVGALDLAEEVEVPESSYWKLITKIRKACNGINSSPKKMDEFEAICRQAPSCKALKLQPDLSFRWNSTFQMLERFLTLERPLRLYFEQQNENFPVSEQDLKDLRLVIPALKAVEEASLHLCRDDTTLFEADVALEFMINQLEKLSQQSIFCSNLLENMRVHLAKRRTVASRLAMYAYTADRVPRLDEMIGESPDSDDIKRELVNFYSELQRVEGSRMSTEEEPPAPIPSTSIEAYTRSYVRARVAAKRPRTCDANVLAADQAELFMKKHDNFGGSNPKLNFPREFIGALDSIPPTSIKAERAFSVARHSRKFTQGRMDADRFTRKFALKNMYNQTTPWIDLMKKLNLRSEVDQPPAVSDSDESPEN